MSATITPRLGAIALAISALFTSFASSANVPAPAQARNTPQNVSLATQPDTDQLIIRFRDNASTAAVDNVLKRMRAEKGENFKYAKTLANNAEVFRFGKRKGKTEWNKLSTWLKSHPEVEYAEPDYIMTKMVTPVIPPSIIPNDPYYSSQWSLNDAIAGIHAESAWGYSTGRGVVVAVVDTGVLPHTDLTNNLLPGYDMIIDTFIANDGNGRDSDATDPGDYVLTGECGSAGVYNSSWHGTHVSGIIAAQANNAKGVSGIAFGAKILPVRVMGKCGGYTSDIAAGIIWAAGGNVSGAPANPNAARVINLSLGGTSECSATLQNAINTARSRNAVVVVAAGNSNTNASQFSPANCAGVITVTATGRDGSKASYANYGTSVDIAAPGGSMYNGTSSGILSTLNSGAQKPASDAYAYYQGTSMATPHVAGVAALVLAANPALTPDQVENILKSSARTFPKTCTDCGAGLLDATGAVQTAINTPADPFAVLSTTLNQNRNLWRTQNALNYSFVLEQKTPLNTNTLRYKLSVRSGVLVAGINLTTNRSLTSRDLFTYGKTIEQLFNSIDNGINTKANSITINYDTTLGYPNSIYIDPNNAFIGDEFKFTLSNLIRQ